LQKIWDGPIQTLVMIRGLTDVDATEVLLRA